MPLVGGAVFLEMAIPRRDIDKRERCEPLWLCYFGRFGIELYGDLVQKAHGMPVDTDVARFDSSVPQHKIGEGGTEKDSRRHEVSHLVRSRYRRPAGLPVVESSLCCCHRTDPHRRSFNSPTFCAIVSGRHENDWCSGVVSICGMSTGGEEKASR